MWKTQKMPLFNIEEAEKSFAFQNLLFNKKYELLLYIIMI